MFLIDIKQDDLKKIKSNLKKVTDFIDNKVDTVVKKAVPLENHGYDTKEKELQMMIELKKLEIELYKLQNNK